MKLIKLFRASDTEPLQAQIDAWLEFNKKNIDIESYQTNVTSSPAGSMIGLTIVVSIVYKKKVT